MFKKRRIKVVKCWYGIRKKKNIFWKCVLCMYVCVCIDGGGGGGGNGVNDWKNVMLWCGIVEWFKKWFSVLSCN